MPGCPPGDSEGGWHYWPCQPSSRGTCSGLIFGVDPHLTTEEILTTTDSEVAVNSSLRKPNGMLLVFGALSLPAYVAVYKMLLPVRGCRQQRPQCAQCGRQDHVTAFCKGKESSRCGCSLASAASTPSEICKVYTVASRFAAGHEPFHVVGKTERILCLLKMTKTCKTTLNLWCTVTLSVFSFSNGKPSPGRNDWSWQEEKEAGILFCCSVKHIGGHSVDTVFFWCAATMATTYV